MFWLVTLLTLNPSGHAQTGSTQADEGREMAMEIRKTRDYWRTDQHPNAVAECAGRARYEGDTLYLTQGTQTLELQDIIDIFSPSGLMNGDLAIHRLHRCADELGLYIVEVSHWEGRYFNLIAQSPNVPSVSLDDVPVASPDNNALILAEYDPTDRAPNSEIIIVLRDANGHWHKVWRHAPADAVGWTFLRWESPSRFRLALYNGLWWESVIEFTPTTLTRTDGPTSAGNTRMPGTGTVPPTVVQLASMSTPSPSTSSPACTQGDNSANCFSSARRNAWRAWPAGNGASRKDR